MALVIPSGHGFQSINFLKDLFFKYITILCKVLPFIKNNYSSFLWAKRNGMDYLIAADVNSEEVVSKTKEINPDLIVSVSMNQIVQKEILQMPPKRCINVHCAPLPKYAGMSPYVWALANNENHSAATIHYMEEGLDEGDIIKQEKVAVLKKDSAFSLFSRCCHCVGQLLVQTVNDIEKSKVSSYRQDLSKKTCFSWPDKGCIKKLKNNGFKLTYVKDFLTAIFRHKPGF
ncbi:methionyl-tRNA formyltransferase [Planctomycetota bacterium]